MIKTLLSSLFIILITTQMNAEEFKNIKIRDKYKDPKEEALKQKLNENALLIQELFQPISNRKISSTEKKFKLNIQAYKYEINFNEMQYDAEKELFTFVETHTTNYNKKQTKENLNTNICKYSFTQKLAQENPKAKINYKVFYIENKKDENKILDKTISLKDCL